MTGLTVYTKTGAKGQKFCLEHKLNQLSILISQKIPAQRINIKKIKCSMADVQGDILQPSHHTTPAAAIAK